LLSIQGQFFLGANPELQSLAALESLNEVNELNVTGNASLPTCEAEALVARLTPPVAATITGNDDTATCE
jgi:hypothetical protein